jgi:hypothetical protein
MISFVYISTFFRETALRFSFTAEAQRSQRVAEKLFLCVSIFPHLFVTQLNQIFKTSAPLRDLCASAVKN